MNNAKLDSHTMGIMAGILSAACFGIVGALVNHLSNTIPATEITFVRGMAGILVILFFVRHHLVTLIHKDALSVWVRAIAGAISILCFSWNLQHTDVGVANILFNLSLIFVLFAGHARLRGSRSLRAIVSMILTALGIILYWYGNEVAISNKVLTVGVGGAIAATIAYVALNKASKKSTPWLIVWSVSLISVPLSLFAKSGNWVLPSLTDSFILLTIALSVLAAHYFLNVSFSKLPLPLATALGPSCIVWSVLGVALLQGVIPQTHALFGMIVYATGLGALIAESKKRQDSLP